MASRQRPRWATLIPKATCAFASERASASAGRADATVIRTASATGRTLMMRTTSLYPFACRTCKAFGLFGHAVEQAICHGLALKNIRVFHGAAEEFTKSVYN